MKNQLTDRIRSALHRGWSSGLPHIVLALVAIQGAAYIVQFAIARIVSPANFGVVRTVEATFSFALVFASAGLPSLAIKSVAAMDTSQAQGRLLRRLIGLVIATSAVTAVALAIGARFVVSPSAAPWLTGFAFLLVPVAVARTSVNFFQGLRIVKRISVAVSVGSAIGVAIVVGLTMRNGLVGWMTGRYIAESVIAVIAIFMCLPFLRAKSTLPTSVRWQALMVEGSAVSSSLLVRSAIDNIPVLSLGWFAVAAADIGYFGLGSLAAAALLLTPGALNTLAIAPLVARLRHSSDSAHRLFVRIHLAAAAMTVPPTLLLIVALPELLRHLAPAYLPGVPVLRALIAVVPLRAATTASGSALLAVGRVAMGLWYNVATLVLCLIALTILVPRYGVTGAAIGIVVAEMASAIMFSWGASRYLNAPKAVASAELIGVLRQELVE